jgi:SAM-dependent methyltransferase
MRSLGAPSKLAAMSRERRLLLLLIGGTVLVTALAVVLYPELVRGAFTPEAHARREVFESVYARQEWGTNARGEGTSGSGSTLGFTRLYRVFLQDFLAAHDIRSVVDAGCGDWEFSQAIDWTRIDYLGVDIVPSVIEANRQRFGKANVRFAVADIVRDELPPADLLLVKDVLQHLSDADISRFLAQLPRYRHVLIVNDVQPDSLTALPVDIRTGGYRPIDLTRPPHGLPGTKVLAWRHGGHTKLVVHLQPAKP